MSLGPFEILIIFIVALVVFGPERLPELMRQVGKGWRELRKVQDSLRNDFHHLMESEESKPEIREPENHTESNATSEGSE